MAHHHRSRNTSVVTTRALPLRIFSVLALILPLILLIISFAFALATIYSPKWAVSDLYYTNGTISVFHDFASPFYNCSQFSTMTDDIEVAGPNLKCQRVHGIGIRGFNDCERVNPKDAHKCQQSALTANLLVAGVVFISIAMALALSALATGFKSATAEKVGADVQGKGGNGIDSAAHDELEAGGANGGGSTKVESVSWTQGLDAGMLFLAATGSVILLLAQVVGVNVFVNEGYGNVNFQEVDPTATPGTLSWGTWYMGKASYVFISVAWLAGLLAAVISRYA